MSVERIAELFEVAPDTVVVMEAPPVLVLPREITALRAPHAMALVVTLLLLLLSSSAGQAQTLPAQLSATKRLPTRGPTADDPTVRAYSKRLLASWDEERRAEERTRADDTKRSNPLFSPEQYAGRFAFIDECVAQARDDAVRHYAIYSEFEQLVKLVNPDLNSIRFYPMARTGYGLVFHAEHAFFNKHTFAASSFARELTAWFKQRGDILRALRIFAVVVESNDPHGSTAMLVVK